MDDKKITSIIFDWFYTTENGEEYARFVVGEADVISIEEHQPKGEGDRWYFDVTMQNGSVNRVFNINYVCYE